MPRIVPPKSFFRTVLPSLLLLLLLSGDVETNPGPPRRAAAASATGRKGSSPTADEKIEVLTQTLNLCESKIADLQTDLDRQRKKQEEEHKILESKLELLTKDLEALKEGGGLGVETLKDKITIKFEETEDQVKHVQDALDEVADGLGGRQDEMRERLTGLEVALEDFRERTYGSIGGIRQDSEEVKNHYSSIEQKVKEIKVEATGKLQALVSTTRDHRREYKAKFVDLDVDFQRMKERLEMLSMILDDMHEKMYEFEQSKRNNLILYGLRNRMHENSDSLKTHVANTLRDHLNIRREVPIVRANRILTGPEVRGCRPVLVTFETFKDRETVLRQAKVLKKAANIDITEDLSKKTRENRQELRKFMRKVKRSNPEKSCFLEYDKLYIDHKIFVYNEALGQESADKTKSIFILKVVEQAEAQRYGLGAELSRPGTQMMMMSASYGNQLGDLGPSRPPSGLGSARYGDRAAAKSASAIPRLPPLSRALSLSTGAMQHIDPRDEKLEEMERMVASYQEKLDNVTTNYQEKVAILENRLVDKDISGEVVHGPHNSNGHANGSSFDQAHNSTMHLQDMSDNETDVEDEAGGSPRHHQPAHAATIHSIPEEKEDMGNASLEMTKQQQKEEEGIINH